MRSIRILSNKNKVSMETFLKVNNHKNKLNQICQSPFLNICKKENRLVKSLEEVYQTSAMFNYRCKKSGQMFQKKVTFKITMYRIFKIIRKFINRGPIFPY